VEAGPGLRPTEPPVDRRRGRPRETLCYQRTLRNGCVYLYQMLKDAPLTWELVMMRLRDVAIVGVASIALAAAPIHSASARWRGGPVFWPFALGAAVVTGAAIVATAPFRYAAPVYAPAYYPPPAAYYPPPQAYYSPPAYYPPQGYYAPPPGYYGR
jgi:hypothetical protein